MLGEVAINSELGSRRVETIAGKVLRIEKGLLIIGAIFETSTSFLHQFSSFSIVWLDTNHNYSIFSYVTTLLD